MNRDFLHLAAWLSLIVLSGVFWYCL